MGGKAHGGRRVSNAEAFALFDVIIRELRFPIDDPIAEVYLCGSARRGKETSGDLDIVAVVRDKIRFERYLDQRFGQQKSGKKAMRNGLIDGVQVEFYEAGDGDLGTFLQMWTGPWEHNVQLRAISLRKGWSMSQYGFRNKGTGELVKCPTEEEVYGFLGVEYVPPGER